MNIVRHLYCFPHNQAQIWEYFCRNQVMTELRERTLLRKAFHSKMISKTLNGDTTTWMPYYFDDINLTLYGCLIRVINMFESTGCKKTYYEFCNLLWKRRRNLQYTLRLDTFKQQLQDGERWGKDSQTLQTLLAYDALIPMDIPKSVNLKAFL